MLLDAFRWQHHTAVMTRIPHGGTFDAERRLHPSDIKCLHLEEALIPFQVRMDEFTFTVCLQGVRNSTSELNIVSLTDSGRPSY